ncbi:MAG: hypothetical protein B7Z10_07490 [Rhodobacterales bacterium 32-66-7]|nr:MAG: hypothetical protein B7Z10_07490 [Rhodobacterales bacterium 32-66-7]
MASLFGRILRTGFVLFVACAVVVTGPLQAAPFAAIVMDARSGEVLYEKNADARLHPASLTKMMTLYIAFQEIEAGNISLDTMITVSDYAAAQPPSRLGLKPGQKIALRYLIRAAAVKSANDAASAIGDAISGDHKAFAKRMTRTAGQLGMDNTTFKNANGLTAEGHLSSARDMNILGRHLFYDFPEYYNIFSRRTADAGIATVTNTNSRFLDGYEGADGIKTGFTSAAGFNLTASAVRGKKRIIATIFGASSTPDRTARMKELLDIGFGAAKNRVKEQPPTAPELLPDDALIAAADGIDVLDAEGGAGKTLRISGEMASSPRPRSRPLVPSVPDAVAIAMVEGIDGALAEATAEPPPEGTLDFQAVALAEGTAPIMGPVMGPPLAPEVEAESVLAEIDPEAVPKTVAEPDTLDAQVAALADAATVPIGDQPALMPETMPESLREAQPETLAETQPEPGPEPAVEIVQTDPGPVAETTGDAMLASAASDPMPEVTGVESVAAADSGAPPPEVETLDRPGIEIAAAPPPTLPERAAPVFDAPVPEPTAEAEQEVVVVMSTSGGRQFGVNVGVYATSYDAERALLKTALAESATLNDGLRKATKSGGSWRASFMGLTEEQAELACRRLRARAVPCETVGG